MPCALSDALKDGFTHLNTWRGGGLHEDRNDGILDVVTLAGALGRLAAKALRDMVDAALVDAALLREDRDRNDVLDGA